MGLVLVILAREVLAFSLSFVVETPTEEFCVGNFCGCRPSALSVPLPFVGNVCIEPLLDAVVTSALLSFPDDPVADPELELFLLLLFPLLLLVLVLLFVGLARLFGLLFLSAILSVGLNE